MEKKQCPRKLDLHAPFLSTRRIELPRISSRRPSWDASNRVPFSWEQSPGKPKGGLKTYDAEHIDVPPPKLPPCRWHPPAELAVTREDGNVGNDCDSGFEEGDFADAIDIFSLSESVDIFDRDVDYGTRESSATQSPSFIIQRYLSDAKALAAASSSSAVVPAATNNNHHSSRIVGQSYTSPKSCGLDIFFPWRMKHKLCGVKTPVIPTRRKHNCSLVDTHFNSCRY